MEKLHYNLAFLFFASLLIIKLLFHRKNNLPPTPFALPIIGHLYLLRKPVIHDSLQNLLSQYGPILFLKLGSQPTLVLSSLSAVEECFTKNDIIFANRPRTVAGDHLSYNYTSIVLAPYGHLWRNQRRFAVVELFSSRSLQKFSSVREEEVRCLLRRLFKASAHGPQKVDLKFLFSLLVTNVIVRTMIGRRYIEEDAAGTKVEKQLFQEFQDRYVATAVVNICDFVPILKFIGYKGIEKNLRKFHGMRDEFLQNWLDEIRSKRNDSSLETAKMSDGKEKKSVIENLLSLQDLEPEFYTNEVVKSITMNMLVAGTETTTITLEWAMSLLLNHPKVLQKLKAEIDNHVGYESLLKDSDLVKLPFLRCVINETLRLYPPAPLLLPHFSSEVCSVGRYEIPQGTMLIVNAWAMQRDPKVWEQPNDFKPERFERDLGAREGFAYLPFGMGRRACPGAPLALKMASLALGTLIQCFEWNKIGLVEDMSYAPGPTLRKAKPLEAMCCPRQNMTELLSSV